MLAILVGIGVNLGNIGIHGVLTVIMVRAVHGHMQTPRRIRPTARMILVMILAGALLMTAHLIEIWVWSVIYGLSDVTPVESEDFAFAFVNYTTLGYGNVLPLPPWEVLGPMTAMNGVLLFGWSTAVLFQVLWVTSQELHIRY